MKFMSRLRFLIKNELTEAEQTEIAESMTLSQLTDIIRQSGDNDLLCSSTYYTCMLIRCNAIAKMPIQIKKMVNDNVEEDKKHVLNKILGLKPNPYQSIHDLLWQSEFNRLHYGNSFWYMKNDGTSQRELYCLNPTATSIIIDDVGLIDKKNAVYYIYSYGIDKQTIFTPDEILHFKNYPTNGIKGRSVKRYLSDTIQSEIKSTNVLNEKLDGGLQDPVVVEYVGDMNEAREKKVQDKFEALSGVKNAGKVLPIPSEFKASVLETKLVDNQFFELRGFTTKQIANAFGVKGFQLNDMDSATYNNVEQQNKVFYSDTMQDVFTMYEQEMNDKLLTTEEKDNGYMITFDLDAVLRSDFEARMTSNATAINNSIYTVAEVRKSEGKKHIEGTDRLINGNGATIFFDQIGSQYSVSGASNLIVPANLLNLLSNKKEGEKK
ncbi:MAG: phage portal protein [Clostridia bacterium]|jgi:HK97 family phage portal protein|nr:phage portal protein [Clostridia bacterium]